MAGLCPLSPIPFIDDLVITYIRRRMVHKVFENGGLPLKHGHVLAITERKTSFLLGCCTGLVIYPIKKIFRKVFYFLAVKDCVDVTSDLLHQGLILQYAIENGHLVQTDLARDDVAIKACARVNVAMEKALDQTDPRPLNQLLKRSFAGSRVLVDEAARLFAALFKKKGVTRKHTDALDDALDDVENREDSRLKGFVDRLTEVVWAKEGYRRDLYARFEKALREHDQKNAQAALEA